jgi:hypothetical protein
MKENVFLTTALVGDKQLDSHPGRLTLRENVPGTKLTRAWVGPWSGLDTGQEKNRIPLQGIEPGFLGRSTRNHCIDWATPIPYINCIDYKINQ